MSQIMPLIEYLVPKDNPLVLYLYSDFTQKSRFINRFNTVYWYRAYFGSPCFGGSFIIMYFIKLCQNAESTIFKSMWGWEM